MMVLLEIKRMEKRYQNLCHWSIYTYMLEDQVKQHCLVVVMKLLSLCIFRRRLLSA